MKKCSKCKIEKPFSEFHKKGDGFASRCKVCRNEYNRDKSREVGHDVLYRRAVERDPEGYAAKAHAYYLANRKTVIARTAAGRAKDPEATKIARRAEYLKAKPRAVERAGEWVKANPERRKQVAREYSQRAHQNPEKRPMLAARKMLSRVLEATGRKRVGRTFTILGYNRQQFEAHLESMFLPGMSWANHGEWHVDHITPVSLLVEKGIICPARINALANLQPLWAPDNHRKHAAFDPARCIFPELLDAHS